MENSIKKLLGAEAKKSTTSGVREHSAKPRIMSQADVKKPVSTTGAATKGEVTKPRPGTKQPETRKLRKPSAPRQVPSHSMLLRSRSRSSGLSGLPPEIQFLIFKHLNTTDLCSVRCVSKSLKEAAEDARLWRNTRLLFKTPDLSRIRALLSAQRFKLVKSVRVSGHIPANKAESILR